MLDDAANTIKAMAGYVQQDPTYYLTNEIPHEPETATSTVLGKKALACKKLLKLR